MKHTITISISDDEREALDVVVENVPLSNKHAVASACFRRGLKDFATDPAKAFEALRAQQVHVGRGRSR